MGRTSGLWRLSPLHGTESRQSRSIDREDRRASARRGLGLAALQVGDRRALGANSRGCGSTASHPSRCLRGRAFGVVARGTMARGCIGGRLETSGGERFRADALGGGRKPSKCGVSVEAPAGPKPSGRRHRQRHRWQSKAPRDSCASLRHPFAGRSDPSAPDPRDDTSAHDLRSAASAVRGLAWCAAPSCVAQGHPASGRASPVDRRSRRNRGWAWGQSNSQRPGARLPTAVPPPPATST